MNPASDETAGRRVSIEERLGAMPGWPALMDARTGSLYLEISTGSFLGLARRRSLRPVDMGLGVVRWRRDELDMLIASLPKRGVASDDQGQVSDFDAALERSSRRAAGRGRSLRTVP